jgi:hypothetical protein
MKWPWKEQKARVDKLAVDQKKLARRIRRVEVIVSAHRIAVEAEQRRTA